MVRQVRAAGGLAWRERFADRGMLPNGRLIPRGEPGALLDERAAIAHARRWVASRECETLCVHGDTPDAVAIARAARAVLDA
jgi:UPF0271 protein